MGAETRREGGEKFATQKVRVFVKNEGGDARGDGGVAERAEATQRAGVGEQRQRGDREHAGGTGEVAMKYCAATQQPPRARTGRPDQPVAREKNGGEEREGVGVENHPAVAPRAALVLRDDFGAFEVEAESDFLQALFAHGVAELFLVASVEHQEATAAGANEFAAEGAVGHGVIIPIVDDGVAHAGAADFFALPMHVHEAGKFVEVAGFEAFEGFVAELFGEMHVVEHRLVVALGLLVLIFEDRGGAARVAGEKQEEVVFEIKERFFGDARGAVFDAAVFVKCEGGNASDGGDVLVLFADGFAEFVELDVAGLFGEFGGGDEALFRRVERFEERSREAAGGAETGAAGYVGHRRELDVRIGDAGEFHRFADDRMLDLVDVIGAFEFGIFDYDARLKRAVLREVDVFVDGRGDEEAAELTVIRRQVGAAAAEGDA